MPKFVDSAVKEIEVRLRELQDEAARLEAAHAALTSSSEDRRRVTRSRGPRATSRSNGRSVTGSSVRGRRSSGTRANQALELVRKQPGITIPEMAQTMKIQPNYLYRVLPRLASDGEIRRDGQGWHPVPSSNSTTATPARKLPSKRQARAAKSQPKASISRTATRGASSDSGPATSNRTARGATTASVLAALAEGDALTAGQVASKAGLARPTVSTTLSKLTKTGHVQKADRGYRLATRG